MQFERSQPQHLTKHGILQESFISNTRLSFHHPARSKSESNKNDDTKKGKSRWSKTKNGGWGHAKKSVEVESIKAHFATKPFHKAIEEISLPKPDPMTLKKEAANAAAIQIQRIARGGWQRLQFRIVVLQHKLDTREERTAAAIAEVQERLRQQKDKYLKKMMKRATADRRESVTAQEIQQVIDVLRKDNKRLRKQNEKLYKAIDELKLENELIESQADQICKNFSQLEDEVKYLEEINEKLRDVTGQYEESINNLQNAIEVRQQYFLSEHLVKVSYMKWIVTVAEKVEDRCEDSKLVDEVVCYCLDIDSSEDDAST
jgi:chromosome segregation ATPase